MKTRFNSPLGPVSILKSCPWQQSFRLLSATVLLAVISCCPKVFDEFTIQGDRLEQFRALSFSLCLTIRTWGEEQDHRKGHKLMTIECVHRFMVLVELIWSRANILLDLPFQFLFHWRFHRVQNMICELIDDCVGDSLGDWASWNRLFINYSSLNQQRLKVCVLFIMYNKSNWKYCSVLGVGVGDQMTGWMCVNLIGERPFQCAWIEYNLKKSESRPLILYFFLWIIGLWRC